MRDLSKISERDQMAADKFQAERDADKMGPRPRSTAVIPPMTPIRTDADRKAEDKALRDLMRPDKPRG